MGTTSAGCPTRTDFARDGVVVTRLLAQPKRSITTQSLKGGYLMAIGRRELCSLFPAVLLSGAWVSSESPSLSSAAFPFTDLQLRVNQNGSGDVRSIVKGATPTGEQVEVHETTLLSGRSPHPPHRHKHSEFWLIREGTVEITISGKHYLLGPGSAAFAASNDEHGIKNIGAAPANYFVVAVGPM